MGKGGIMERRVGEQFVYERMLLKVVADPSCSGCVFNNLKYCAKYWSITGSCSGLVRLDKTSVKFVEVDLNNP